MPPTPEQHEADHERLAAAWDRWVALGRPQGRLRHDPGGRRSGARRALGLRLNAHLAVCHGVPDVFGPAFRQPFGTVTFADVHRRHERMHLVACTVDGTLWHAGSDLHNGTARTLCGLVAEVDHDAEGQPVRAVDDDSVADEFDDDGRLVRRGGQAVECLRCRRSMNR